MSDQQIQDQEPPLQGTRLLTLKRAIEHFRPLESVRGEREVAANRELSCSHMPGSFC